MKNTISIHIGDMFNKEHEFRKGNNPYFYVDAEKSKDNVYFEGDGITKEDEGKSIQMVISFYGDYKKDTVKNTLLKYLNTFEERNSDLKVVYGAIHCDEKNKLPHLHLTYSYIPKNHISFNFEKREKEYLNILFKENLMQEIKKYLNV